MTANCRTNVSHSLCVRFLNVQKPKGQWLFYKQTHFKSLKFKVIVLCLNERLVY